MGLGKVLYRKRLCFTVMFLGTYLAVVSVLLVSSMSRIEQARIPCQGESSSKEAPFLPVNPDIHNMTVPMRNINTVLMEPELEKIDWNDYKFMAQEAQKQGLGEHGVPVVLSLSEEENKIKEDLFKQFNYNAYLSDRISLERSIGDLRTNHCKTHKFIRNIPNNSVSVIIVFHNEKNSTLLRTVHSVINRSPGQLLREIVLVDDFSTLDEVRAPLDAYISQHFSKVRVIRNAERTGLIRSRMSGADSSSGSFLVFLDAHVEVNHNYLPPLLEPMVLDYKTVTCPIVDYIMEVTFNVWSLNKKMRGAFDWNLEYVRIPVYGMDETTPYASPVMVGCAFAITRRWWEELGKYDPGLEIWGAEQYEMSFKTWQCGGRLLDAPCSRVAHLFRPLPYVKEVVQNNTIEKNYLRLTSVWMDEYKKFVLQRRYFMRFTGAGNITEQLALRKRLKCKPFKWFMDVIAPDILKYYPLVEPPSIAWGRIQSNFNTSMCIVKRDFECYLDGCMKPLNEENFLFDWRNHIRIVDMCVTNVHSKSILLWSCMDIEYILTQAFAWNHQNGHIVNFASDQCLDFDLTTFKLLTNKCDDNSSTQSWRFDGLNLTEVNRVWSLYTSSRSHKKIH